MSFKLNLAGSEFSANLKDPLEGFVTGVNVIEISGTQPEEELLGARDQDSSVDYDGIRWNIAQIERAGSAYIVSLEDASCFVNADTESGWTVASCALRAPGQQVVRATPI